MKPQNLAVSLIVALGVTAVSFGEDITAEARIAAQQVAVTTCATCHGRQGRSITPKFPVLAGQHAGYLAAQLHAFKSQTRGDPDALGYMWGMSAPLDDEMINALGAYYAAQSPAQAAGILPEQLARRRHHARSRPAHGRQRNGGGSRLPGVARRQMRSDSRN